MGPAIDALGDVVTLVRYNPIIVAVGVVAAILSFASSLLLRQLSIVVYPLFVGGMLATVWAGRNGEAELGDFLAGAKDNYLSLLGANLLFALSLMGAAFIAALVAIVPTFFLGFSSSGGLVGSGATAPPTGVPGGSMLAGLGVFLFVVFAVFVLVIVAVAAMAQLFDVAIVAEGRSAVGGFNRAWELFRAAPGSLLGYTILRGLIGAIIVVVPLLAVAALGVGVSLGLGAGMDAFGPLALVLLALYLLVLVPAGFVFAQTYHVAYFNRLTARVG